MIRTRRIDRTSGPAPRNAPRPPFLLVVHFLALLLVSTLASTPVSGQPDGEEPGELEEATRGRGTEDAPLLLDIPDSVRVDRPGLPDSLGTVTTDSVRTIYTSSADAPLRLDAFEVRARRIVRDLGADHIELSAGLIESRDGGSVADLGTLLPSTHLTVNSRGEALFQVRGSSERHLRVRLDGIPLTLPWDERTDLSLLPLLGVGSVSARRGVNSALDPIHALAGVVDLETRTQPIPGTTTRLGAWAGEAEAWGLQFLHLRQDGPWNTTVALEHRRRAGFLLPDDLEVDYFDGTRAFENQDPSRRLRTNSELEQSALLARVGRAWGDGGDLRLLVQASDGEKGVPPEMHEEPADARFWRYPQTQRLLVGAGARRTLGAWTLDAAGSMDWHAQDIEKYDGIAYDEVTGFEYGRDRTLYSRARIDRRLSEDWDLAVRGTLRHATRDQEEDGIDGELEFSQTLGGVAAELVHRIRTDWRVRAGAGYEGARTPRTGDKPARDADHDLTLHLATELDTSERSRLHAALSRRPRFPSMRELFSEALDRFLVNPDLGPETQTAAELGFSRQGRDLEWSINGFAQLVDGAIERRNVDVDGRTLRQRVNLDEVRNLGLELGLLWRPLRGVSLDWQHTQLWSRSKVDGSFDARVEDRPDWLTTLAAAWTHPGGLGLRTELVGVGRRFSLGTEGLEPLDADLRWNLRLSYRHFGRTGWYQDAEIFLRLDNVLDATTEAQIGLPESGRTVRVGWRIDLQT